MTAMSIEIDWDKIIKTKEQKDLKSLWEKVGSLSRELEGDIIVDDHLDQEIDQILDQIATEEERINPNNSCSFDHEEVWRATGKYLVVKRK
jgi:hypothetical protein